MKINLPTKAAVTPWQSVLAVRPPHETPEEKSETAKWLVRVVPTVSPAEQDAIWATLWSEYPTEACGLLRGYVQLYAPAYRAVLRAHGAVLPAAPAAGAFDLPGHLLAAVGSGGRACDSHNPSTLN